LAGALLALVVGPGAVFAHGAPADLSVWGGFNPQVARCQRSIARAASLCASRTLYARTKCGAAQLRGESCDTAALDASIQAARGRARDTVARDCDGEQLTTLRYVDLGDAQADVINICRQLDTAASSAAFAPASFGGTIAAMSGTDQTCVDTTSRAGNALLRYAMRTRQRALDTIAATVLAPATKTSLIARSQAAINRAATITQARVAAACPGTTFHDLYGQDMATVLGRIAGRADCLGQYVYVQNAVVCPPAQCGDGMQIVPDEECDDGNDYDGDGCRTDCVKTECDAFPTTYDLLQKAIFENHGCTDDACHGSTKSGGLDLRAGASYASLVDVESGTVPGTKRVDPGSKETSLLWINLAARTRPDQVTAPVRGMPIGGAALSEDELDALGIWIETGGAARDANLAQAANLLAACVPEPHPVKIDPLEPPPAGVGLQMHMPAWTLEPKSESEVCFTSYYDFTGQIPADLLSADGKRFRYKSVEIRQDPLSHHLIVDVYRGEQPPTAPSWGTYKCRGGAKDGTVCNPTDFSFCGAGADCATDPDPASIACIGFGPVEGLGTLGSGGFAFAQETTAHFRFPEAVYNELPVKGNILWNSHAFNLTRQSGTLEAWVNIIFPKENEQDFAETQIFDVSQIFWNENFPPFPQIKLPPFAAKEFCNLHTFSPVAGLNLGGSVLAADETAHVFELSGHMHRHGKRFQIYRGAFTCAGGSNVGAPCNPQVQTMCPGSTCVEAAGRDPQQSLLYTNLVYNDPVILRLDPPLLLNGAGPEADRTFTYCGYYDNGATNPQDVKRRSTSPPPGVIFDAFTVGGPCAQNDTQCIGGPNQGMLCNGNNAVCDSSAGAGDGECDACPLTGGFRTQDEMFILFGNYWATKNP
jgi:cysteine-rich repeat protein